MGPIEQEEAGLAIGKREQAGGQQGSCPLSHGWRIQAGGADLSGTSQQNQQHKGKETLLVVEAIDEVEDRGRGQKSKGEHPGHPLSSQLSEGHDQQKKSLSAVKRWAE